MFAAQAEGLEEALPQAETETPNSPRLSATMALATVLDDLESTDARALDAPAGQV